MHIFYIYAFWCDSFIFVFSNIHKDIPILTSGGDIYIVWSLLMILIISNKICIIGVENNNFKFISGIKEIKSFGLSALLMANNSNRDMSARITMCIMYI